LFSEELTDAFLVTMPGLVIREEADGLFISNPALGTSAECPEGVRVLLEFFRSPRRLEDLLAAGLADPETLLLVVDNGFVIDVALGFTAAEAPVGVASEIKQILDIASPNVTVVFGVPTDAAAMGNGGARNGPELIRTAFRRYPWFSRHTGRGAGAATRLFQPKVDGGTRAGLLLDFELRRTYRGEKPSVFDLGDLVCVPGEPLRAIGDRVSWLVDQIMEKNGRPVMLGGDHSITHYSLSSVARRYHKFGIIHFDAHHDTYAQPFGFITHANPFRGALESSSLVALFQIGLRTVEWAETDELVTDPRVRYLSALEVAECEPAQVFSSLDVDVPYYLSFDIDCISPHLAPETGTPEPGGLSYYRALRLVDEALRRFQIIGADFVEVAGPAGQKCGAADVAARLVFQTLVAGVPFEPLGNYVSRNE